MPGTDIAFTIETAPAVQMLRMRNAHWVLPFLYQVFKEGNLFSIQEPQLITLLAEALSLHADGTEDIEEARIEFGEDEESRARKYLLNWVQKRLLQDLPGPEGEVIYQLSSHAEKVFQWLQTLQKRQFVGTESRFKILFSSLRDMVEKTEDDRTIRLEELKNRRAEIDKEIKALEMGAPVEVYSNAQVQERLELFTRLCYELISDFREVEDNFKQIHRNIVEQHTRAELNKGAIIGYAFESYDALRTSDQGKSFYAFWDFLISRAGQEDWRNLTDELVQLLEEREIPSDHSFLENIKSLLLQQGRTVYDANDKMAEKLSRIITEKEIAYHRRLRQQISNIKELVFELMDEEEAIPCGISIEQPAEIRLVMDRKLTTEQKKTVGAVKQPLQSDEKIGDMERFNRMLNTSFVDKKKLWGHVETVLKQQQTATLKEVVEKSGLENGIAEIVAYYSFLRDKGSRVQLMKNITEHIPVNTQQTKFLEVPYLLFSK
jgi:hypothetical protein